MADARKTGTTAGTPPNPTELLRLIDGWLDATRHDAEHPWRVSIAQTLAAHGTGKSAKLAPLNRPLAAHGTGGEPRDHAADVLLGAQDDLMHQVPVALEAALPGTLPLAQVRQAAALYLQRTGRRPNTLLLSADALAMMLQCSDYWGNLRGDAQQITTLNNLKCILSVDNIVVTGPGPLAAALTCVTVEASHDRTRVHLVQQKLNTLSVTLGAFKLAALQQEETGADLCWPELLDAIEALVPDLDGINAGLPDVDQRAADLERLNAQVAGADLQAAAEAYAFAQAVIHVQDQPAAGAQRPAATGGTQAGGNAQSEVPKARPVTAVKQPRTQAPAARKRPAQLATA